MPAGHCTLVGENDKMIAATTSMHRFSPSVCRLHFGFKFLGSGFTKTLFASHTTSLTLLAHISTIATYNVLTGLLLSYKNMAPASE